MHPQTPDRPERHFGFHSRHPPRLGDASLRRPLRWLSESFHLRPVTHALAAGGGRRHRACLRTRWAAVLLLEPPRRPRVHRLGLRTAARRQSPTRPLPSSWPKAMKARRERCVGPELRPPSDPRIVPLKRG